LKTALVRVSCIQNTQIRGETIAKVFGKVDTFWTYQVPVVQSANRRFTHSCLKLDGLRPQPIMDGRMRPKKKQRAKFLLEEAGDAQQMTEVQIEKEKEGSSAIRTTRNQEEVQIPKTPIVVMQSVGLKLGIDPKKLTKEQLEADPKEKTSPSVKKMNWLFILMVIGHHLNHTFYWSSCRQVCLWLEFVSLMFKCHYQLRSQCLDVITLNSIRVMWVVLVILLWSVSWSVPMIWLVSVSVAGTVSL
jgi:hypothetical protein